MNKILKQLSIETFDKTENFTKVIGNYKIERTKYFIFHYYYNHLICVADLDKKEFYLSHCGFIGYRLTTAQLNYLKKFYENKDFKFGGYENE